MIKGYHRHLVLISLQLLFLVLPSTNSSSPCPWSTTTTTSQQNLADHLESSCTCDYNLAHELSVQCDAVDFTQLLAGLRRYAAASLTQHHQGRIDLLYVNNSTIGLLRNNTFAGLRIANLQLSGCRIKAIEQESLTGQETSLRSLNLRDNELKDVPRDALAVMKNLTVLDLSRNKIDRLIDSAFAGHRLVTLKLAGNNELALDPNCFRGLESSLKNLNLMGTRQRRLPESLRNLRVLAFLDLSQNSIRGLGGADGFYGLNALTGLNLERNLIQSIGHDAFAGISNTLSSLSLLNNLIPEFPSSAIASLRELKVLDIGFNLMTELPLRAFDNNPSITLLAIDGNPMSTVPEEAFANLNGTLRGLSLGGRFLVCDCKLRWIIDWIRTRDLQVTSRESKPQFCGSPQRLQERSFYTIKPEEMDCEHQSEIVGIGTVESVEPTGALLEAIENGQQSPTIASSPSTTLSTSTYAPSSSSSSSSTRYETSSINNVATSGVATHTPTTLAASGNKKSSSATSSSNVFVTRTSLAPRPPLVHKSSKFTSHHQNNIVIKDVLRHDTSLIIRWDIDTPVLGFRVVYRPFGDMAFQAGAPLGSSEREFKIKNVPAPECLIVCVLGAEDGPFTPSNVPYNQCKEVRIEAPPTSSNLDRLAIAGCAIVLSTIVLVAFVLLCANRLRRRTTSRKLHTLQEPGKLPITGLPVNCCSSLVGPTPSPSNGNMVTNLSGNQASLSAYSVQKEWDQLSAYSTRSIPRPRIFTGVERQASVTRTSCLDENHHGPGSLNGVGIGGHARGAPTHHYFPSATIGSSFVGLGTARAACYPRY